MLPTINLVDVGGFSARWAPPATTCILARVFSAKVVTRSVFSRAKTRFHKRVFFSSAERVASRISYRRRRKMLGSLHRFGFRRPKSTFEMAKIEVESASGRVGFIEKRRPWRNDASGNRAGSTFFRESSSGTRFFDVPATPESALCVFVGFSAYSRFSKKSSYFSSREPNDEKMCLQTREIRGVVQTCPAAADGFGP